jgi:hypothetical protein
VSGLVVAIGTALHRSGRHLKAEVVVTSFVTPWPRSCSPTLAEMLGRARQETTQRYTRVSIDRLRTVHASAHPARPDSALLCPQNCVLSSLRDLASAWEGRSGVQ